MFQIKENDMLISLAVANISRQSGGVPAHLKVLSPLNEREFDSIKGECKSVPNLVRKF